MSAVALAKEEALSLRSKLVERPKSPNAKASGYKVAKVLCVEKLI
jgi:hypothetical protein